MRTILILCLLITSELLGQVANSGMVNVYDSLEKGKVTVGGLVDVYYGYDLNHPINSDRPYAISSARHNEINVNLAYADFRYINDFVRAHFVPGFGTYVNANYAGENGTLKNMLEANVGVRLSKKRDIWVDAGVLPSPYTNESAISKDHLMYTRSFAPEYVPYYLSGVKLSLPVNSKLKSYFYLLNGWQAIQDINNPLSLGTQIEYRPNNKILFNWDTYVGDESSVLNPEFRTRYFSDLYMIWNPDGKWSATACAYLGYQEKKDSLSVQSYSSWWQVNGILQYRFNKKAALAFRVEYFEDPNSVQIKSNNGINGFSSYSSGFCFNYKINKNSLFRLESRTCYSDKDVYLDRKRNPYNLSQLFIANMCVWF